MTAKPQMTNESPLPLADRSIGSATLYLILPPPPPERAERGRQLSKEEHPNRITLCTSLFHGGNQVTHLSSNLFHSSLLIAHWRTAALRGFFLVKDEAFLYRNGAFLYRKAPSAGLGRKGQTRRNRGESASARAGSGMTRIFRHRHYRGFNQSAAGGEAKYNFERYYYGII
jgi:hypothetical protein